MRLHLPTNESKTKPSGLPSCIVTTSSVKTKSIISSYGFSTIYDEVFTDPDPDPYLASAQYNLSITKAIPSHGTYLPGGSSKSSALYTAVIDTGLSCLCGFLA
jgi:hypothetical protein